MSKLRYSLVKLRMTADGAYEIGTGRYFGQGIPVYRYSWSDGEFGGEGYLRASTREEAIAKIRDLLEHCN